MVNLIKKDIITTIISDKKQIIKYILVFLGAYLILNALTYSILSVFISYLMLANTFYCDYENNSRNFIKSMPVSKEDIVYSKYIMGIGLILITTTIITLSNQILSIFFYRGPVLNDVLFSVNIFLMIISFVLPMYFKFGYNKVRILAGISSVFIGGLYSGFLNLIGILVYMDKQVSLGIYIGYGMSFAGPFSNIFQTINDYMMNNINVTYVNLYTISIATAIIFILSMYTSIRIAKSSNRL